MTKDMTKGAIAPLIIKFTIPLILGNLLQLTYNAVDSIIVGQYVGKEALAAVGTGNPLMTLVILFTQGICLGAGVLTGALYGAKKYDVLKRQISTAMISGIVFSLAVTLLFLPLASVFLSILRIDPGIRKEAAVYLRIILCGLSFSFLYNFFASILRALGDSRSPLYFLGISAVINIFGDLIFVVLFSMGTVGCAVCISKGKFLCWIWGSSGCALTGSF